MKNRKFISVLLSFSLVFGTILVNATSISFDEIETIETESNISFEDIETEETVSEELTNTDSNIYYEEIDSSKATEEQENIETVEQSTLFSVKANQEVQVSVTNKPVVDVVLSSKETQLDLTNFETDLKQALLNLGVNIDEFMFKVAQTQQLTTDSFSPDDIMTKWGRIGAKGNWQITSYGGKRVIYNSENTDGITGFYYADRYNLKDMTIEYNMRTTDTDNDYVGALFRFNLNEDATNIKNKKATSYMYIEALYNAHEFTPTYGLYKLNNQTVVDYAGTAYSDANGSGHCNLKFPYQNLQTIQYGYPTRNTWCNYKFVVEGNNIKGYRNGSLFLNCTDPNPIPTGSFGFVNYSQPAMFADFSVTYTTYKEYKEILTQPEWRDEAHHIVVGVDDEVDDSLTGSGLGESLSRTLNDKIHLLYWGTDTNKTDTEAFISYNDNKGAFYDNSNYVNCVNETALYIKNLIDQTKESQYVIVGQKTNIDVLPAELKNNASSDDYPQGRWFIHHDYQYFDNNTGLSTQSEFYTPNLLCEFDKPGKYEIYFDDQLVKEIYAHRRPVAEFGMQVNGTSVSLNSESYDLDSNENIGYGKGIASENWYYKESNETIWHSGKLDTIDLEKTYIIKLEVTDKQGESNYTTKYVGSGIPVAAFNYASDTINQYNPLNVRNTSYDPKGLDIVSQEWILKKNGSTVGTYSSPLTDFSSLGTGNYTYTLTVTNSQGIKSEAYTKAFNVVDDNIEPSVIINPTNCDWKTGTQSVSVIFSDGESGFQKWRYAITNSQTKPSSGWSDYKTSSSDTITVTDTDIQYLHIEALDNAGNLLSRTVGTYKIDNEAPIINDIPVTVGNNSAEVKANAIDNHSGIDSYTLTGPSFNKTQKSDTFIVTLPGVYTLTVTDKVGNQTSKEVEVNVYYPITIVWKDENMPPELKPDTIILQAKDGEEVVKEVELPNGTTDYTFKDLPINDDYTFDLIVSDRYDIEVTDQTIVVTYHASNFSVVIPKSITLNGITGTGSYLVKVSGEFFYNDTLTVKPNTSFTLNDRSNISKMTGKVEQAKSVFTKDSLQNARGNISVNRTYFSGIWRGNYYFDVKFVMMN